MHDAAVLFDPARWTTLIPRIGRLTLIGWIVTLPAALFSGLVRQVRVTG